MLRQRLPHDQAQDPAAVVVGKVVPPGKGRSTAMETQHSHDPPPPPNGARLGKFNNKSSLSQRQRRTVPPITQSPPSEKEEKIDKEEMEFKDLSRKSQWIALSIMSGACAAFNGVFAKLTTTELTTTFATGIAKLLGLGDGEKVVEVIVRSTFFALNLLFNAIMWTLFTKALSRGTSTTQVSILNTSSNFMITAVLGFLIFSESLPPLWFLGAALLVAGNVIIGRREEEEGPRKGDVESRSGEDDALLVIQEGVEVEVDMDGELELEIEEQKRKERELDDVLQFDLSEEGERSDDEDLI